VITAATPEIPAKLQYQLKIGGRMVVPVGDNSSQVMTLVIRRGEEDFEYSSHGTFVFVPMLKGTVNKQM
jgi:protein-L-isoaspartate(D-aspartate) O-methyltransferase